MAGRQDGCSLNTLLVSAVAAYLAGANRASSLVIEGSYRSPEVAWAIETGEVVAFGHSRIHFGWPNELTAANVVDLADNSTPVLQ